MIFRFRLARNLFAAIFLSRPSHNNIGVFGLNGHDFNV